MTGHDDHVEPLIPTDRSKVTKDPLDVRPLTRLVKHPASGVESAQSSAMAGLPCPVQQGTRPATDVEHGLRGHHQSQVETEVVPSLRRAEHVLQLGETVLGEQTIDHHTSVPDPRTTSPAHALRPRPR